MKKRIMSVILCFLMICAGSVQTFAAEPNTQVAGAGYFDVMPLRVFLVHHAIDSCMIVDGQKADRGLGS